MVTVLASVLWIVSLALTTTEVFSQNGRIWTIARGHDWGSHDYFDDEGYLSGFGSTFLPLICAEAEMDCRIVWDKYSNCWKSSPGQRSRGGEGLMDGWYDACTGWVQTIERIHTFSFTLAYMKVLPSYFFVLKGKSFDASDLDGKTIAFMEGWADSEQCVARATNIKNNVIKGDKLVHVEGPVQAMEFLESNKVDAVFTDTVAFNKKQREKLRRVDHPVNCYLSGNSMMVRKDNEFPAFWNIGLNKARTNGKLDKICEKHKEEHGEERAILCVDSY